jgi:hypothetical protein
MTTENFMHEAPIAPLVIRGRIIQDDLVEHGGRGGDLRFLAPDARKYLEQLPLGHGGKLADLYALSFDDILDYLDQLGQRLDIRHNPHLQRARVLSYHTAPTTPPIVDAAYARLGHFFQRDVVREIADTQIGIPYLEGWVEQARMGGLRLGVRCFGSRTLHIVAGNAPAISALSIVRNAILRSDAIIKAPSNDPFTALAIAQTMCEMDPGHPITRHLTVAYWRGGDTEFEERLYQPQHIEKIVAWGGFASVKHVTRYIQPGLELISLDPKRSASVIGPQAFESETMLRAAALRVASDFGGINQVGCVNARVIYCLCGTGPEGLEKLEHLGRYAHEALLELPPSYSTKPKSYDRELKAHVDALRLDDDWYTVIGGEDNEGAVIVSRLPEAVDFAARLNDRTANLVPVDSLEQVLGAMNAYTQTVGVFPESLKQDLLDRIPLYGAQRIVSLGYACAGTVAAPQDGIEALRRMGKWITNEISLPGAVPAPWSSAAS